MATNKASIQKGEQASSVTPEGKAQFSLLPSLNAAIVINAYQGNLLGSGSDMFTMINGLRDTFNGVKSGDLDVLEAMLIGQATALQTIFTSLAKRAAHQEQLPHYEVILGLALKAQAQSRATISALADLKYPRQATFVKQANIAHGPQQVNNGNAPTETQSHAQEIKPVQNELLEDASHGSTQLDDTATATAARGHTTVETVATVNWTAKRKG